MNDTMSSRYAEIAANYDGADAVTLGKAMIAARASLDEISAEKARMEAVIEFLRFRLPEVMADAGLTKMTVTFGETEKRIRIQEEVFISATQESGAASRVVDLLKNSGNGGLVKETVAPATLKKFVCDLRKNQGGMPDPLLMEMIEAGMTVTAKDMARFY